MSLNFDSVSTLYPFKSKINILEIEIPKDIENEVNKLENVARFNNSPLFPDNSKVHTIRCIYRAKNLPQGVILNEPRRVSIERTLWIHDIPEMFDKEDVSYSERFNSKKVTETTANREYEVAEELLSKSDIELFKDFQIAEQFTGKFHNELPKNHDSIIAKVIDLTDGDLTYFFYYLKALAKNKLTPEIKHENPYDHQVFIYRHILNKLITKNVSTDVIEIVKLLLIEKNNVITDMCTRLGTSLFSKAELASLKKLKEIR